jgi:plasmid stability protein
MRSVQIKNVPDEVHEVLRRRAFDAGQSLQEFLLAHLTDYAQTPTLAEAFARIDKRSGSGITSAFAVEAIRADRDSR